MSLKNKSIAILISIDHILIINLILISHPKINLFCYLLFNKSLIHNIKYLLKLNSHHIQHNKKIIISMIINKKNKLKLKIINNKSKKKINIITQRIQNITK
jgi:hypothetical protein